MENYKSVIEDYKNKGWESKPFHRMLNIKDENPQDLLPFLKTCITDVPKGGTL